MGAEEKKPIMNKYIYLHQKTPSLRITSWCKKPQRANENTETFPTVNIYKKKKICTYIRKQINFYLLINLCKKDFKAIKHVWKMMNNQLKFN